MNKSLGSVPLLLNALVNHVGLPPRLPGKQEEGIDEIEDALTVRLLNACRALRDLTEGELSQQWDRIRKILQICKVVNAGGKLDKASLLSEFQTLERKDLLILHVTEQNAGLLIRRNHGPQGEIVTFEALEVSALSQKVLAAENALQWDFPGCAVAIPYSDFVNSSFQDNLAAFLEQASTESVKRFAAQAHKAGSFVYESRDTVEPSLITQTLMTLLEAHGYQVFPPPLRKRVRDDVCLTSGAEKPWRRSGYWLLLRVALGRYLCTLHGDEAGRAHYKFLFCLVLARLIDEILEHLSPELFELLAFLNAKLTRRIAKLEVNKDRASKKDISLYNIMFSNLGNLFRQTTSKANQRIHFVWNEFKNTIKRPIPLITGPAHHRDLILTLTNSGPYLRDVLSSNNLRATRPQAFVPYQLPMGFGDAETPFKVFAENYFSLSELESDIELICSGEKKLKTEGEARCMELAAKLEEYLGAVAGAYNSNPEQKSFMILTVVELWILIDRCATELFCLLLDYNPGIPPGILDVLQLPRMTDMYRLNEIQRYLSDRLTECKLSRMTIFHDPVKGCFAERYFEESKDSHKLQKLHESIETAAELARQRKEKEWQGLSADFENLGKSIAEKSCLFTMVNGRGEHSDQQCTKCYLRRKARRMRIQIHEHPLPSNLNEAKAVVFELSCPKSFAAYRNVTWKLIGTLARSEKLDHFEPKLALGDYSELQAYGNSKRGGVSLASTTKSWLKTHYKGVGFPVNISQVCVRNGLKLGYYDPISKYWPGRQSQAPSFAHHCRMKIPVNSPFSSLQLAADEAVESIGPSSYEVVASQTKCPSGLNLHEFMAYQSLLSGKSRRWPLILIELGSSNLNFSTEAITLLIAQLALQAGPAYNLDPLRTVHRVFQDRAFCKRLIEQIDQRLDAIYFNWRETNCMEMVLTLILRFCSNPSKHITEEAFKLLEKARLATFRWIGLLRKEIHRPTDASTFQRCSRYALWAALLCRRTFAMYTVDQRAGQIENLQPSALACFIECSITLQDNSVDDPATLPPVLRNILIRDLKMVYQMRFLLQRSVKASPESLESVINTLWPQAEGDISRSFYETKFLEHPYEWWIQTCIQATLQSDQHAIHFNLLEGHLFIDGKPLGKLPAKHRESLVLGQLFGNKSLLTYPSERRGMAYMVAHVVNHHQIHIGFRNDCLFVQACYKGAVLELIPHTVFGSPPNFDLPASLIGSGRFDGVQCVHWLNIQTGILEIRQGPEIWKPKSGNWKLDFNTRQAYRNAYQHAHRHKGGSWLVDPYSSLFQRVARIFHRFELPDRLTVFQPKHGHLSVEMRRLELTFVLNRRNLFECRQLGSEVDRNQDAGTWYGLDSKLILQDIHNRRQRSILVPLGEIRYARNDIHVTINVVSNGNYGRFTINDVLGRIECPTEPMLLYFKAQFHAYTSSVVPDPLTGRTGTEEALHCLKSGYCQPWTPLNLNILHNLMLIANLTPEREYYPKDLNNMQNVIWNPHLTTTIQHDAFRPTVQAICEKSERLSYFSAKNTELPSPTPKGNPAYLLRRSHQRRCLYQRPNASFDGSQAADTRYDARDRRQASQSRLNAFETVTLIRNWSTEMPKIPKVVDILQSWPTIGGYDRTFDKFLLSDLLDVQFGLEWGSLVNLCRMSGPKEKWQLTFLFAVMSFRNDVEMDILRVLIAFIVSESLKALDPPEWPSYTQFCQNEIPSSDHLSHLIKSCAVQYAGDERSTLGYSLSFKLRRKLELAQQAHEQQTNKDCKVLVEYLLEQWPCPEPTIVGFSRTLLVDVPQALEIIRPEWLRLYQNKELSNYIQVVQNILDLNTSRKKIDLPKLSVEAQEATVRFRGSELPDLSQNLLRKRCPILSTRMPQQITSNEERKKFPSSSLKNGLAISQKENIPNNMLVPSRPKCVVPAVSREIQELESIIHEIAKSQSTVHQRYGRDMMQSLDALKIIRSVPKYDLESINLPQLRSEIFSAQRTVRELFGQISLALERNDARAPWLKAGGLWPCITPITLLEQLRSTSASKFGAGMKQGLVEYATSITNLQHLLRLEDAYLKGNKQRLLEEQNNDGHGNWQPLENPDWLLVEIDANILIRHDQVDVALATISPASGSNSVLQMNMGQGKTSCIMPMVAAVLADTKRLVRVVVPNPLLLQTAQVLQARLGGLLGREITHVPFSRKTSTNPETIKTYFSIHKEVRASSGVMVALPEHILSFMLSGLQRLLDSRLSEATQMITIQKQWMQEVCRDILDECDFTLAVRTQLIYPSGSQTTVDGHPHRWETAEALLRLVESHLWNLQREFPRSIEVVRRPQGGFPMIFFLRKDVEDALIAWLVKNISRGQTSIIPTKECSQSDRLAIKQFISEVNVRPAVTERIRQLFPDKPSAQQNLYLLRGLLVHRILLLTLKKRWNVQYGLHPTRDPIAVPFHAKGVPSDQSEWGHPDCAILFTCLAFYYDGLNRTQLRQSLEHVVKSDDPSSEYDRWSQSSNTLPDSLHEWNVINVDDEAQLIELWQHFRYKVVVIDYYLNRFVFPKHAKQSQMKLQASGWDIPLFLAGNESTERNGSAEKSLRPLTTGFSGTNDNRTMLPLTIKQEDLRGLSHTNTEVLTYLLQPRSRNYQRAVDPHGKHFSETNLLSLLRQQRIRMLIDAGAQILEMDNLSLVKAWLKEDTGAPAAVFFNTENKLTALYRHGSQVPLSATPFAENLGECLVYLDDAHTRGTDLKMPAHAKAALTLGLGQTKDQTVQAAMRLRQLGTSQSIVFFAPPEVHQSIIDLRQKKYYDPIDSYDVICWLVEQTCVGIEQIQPLYISQGTDFCRRNQAASDHPNFLVDINQRDGYLNSLRQTEHQTLEQLYKPKIKPKLAKISNAFCPKIFGFMKELNNRRRDFRDLGNAVHGSALQEVEQEREVAFEVEAVRKVQKPIHYPPLQFPGLHKDIRRFVETGRLAAGCGGYEHAFSALRRTALGLKYGFRSEAMISNLFVSKEFAKTVKMPMGRLNDNFIRPVNWILWSSLTETALVIIPEEAEHVIALFRDITVAFAHLLTYAAPVTRKMLHFNNLGYYAIPAMPAGWKPPAWLTIELGLIAGRLYFAFEEYSDLRKYLGFREKMAKPKEKLDDSVHSTELQKTDRGADDTADEEEIMASTREGLSFTAKPLAFMQDWLAVRRKGQDFKHTPMGYICQDKQLTADHPFYTRVENDGGPKIDWREGKAGGDANEDVDSDVEFDEDDAFFDVAVDEAEGLDGFDELDAEKTDESYGKNSHSQDSEESEEGSEEGNEGNDEGSSGESGGSESIYLSGDQ